MNSNVTLNITQLLRNCHPIICYLIRSISYSICIAFHLVLFVHCGVQDLVLVNFSTFLSLMELVALQVLLYFQVPISEQKATFCNLVRHFEKLRWIIGVCRCLEKSYNFEIQLTPITHIVGVRNMDHNRDQCQTFILS